MVSPLGRADRAGLRDLHGEVRHDAVALHGRITVLGAFLSFGAALLKRHIGLRIRVLDIDDDIPAGFRGFARGCRGRRPDGGDFLSFHGEIFRTRAAPTRRRDRP